MQFLLILSVIGVACSDGGWQAPPAKDALKQLDPVELCEGREIPGKESLAVTRGLYRYLFASEATKAKFEKDPERYGIQLGGGCGRMGLLSGKGDPNRFKVHQGKIYIFAHDLCLKGFTANPEKCLDRPDSIPQGSPVQEQRAQQLIQKALEGFGGAATVDGVRTFQAEVRKPYKTNEGTFDYVTRRTVQFPDGFSDEQLWKDWRGAFVANGDAAWNTDGKFVAPMEECERLHLLRQFHNHPLVALKARNEKGFKALALGQGKVDEMTVELLQVSVHGATTTFGIDPQSGRIVSSAYRGRIGNSIGAIERRFSDFRNVNGIVLPFKAVGTFDGKPAAGSDYHSLKINESIDKNLFTQPIATK